MGMLHWAWVQIHTVVTNVGTRLPEEINLLPLSLQPINLGHHEGHELHEPADVNPTNAANTAA
jgi:hypothetical protein